MAEIGFKGGAALEARLKEIAARSDTAHSVRAGFLENATYPDGTHVATVAAIQEWGATAKNIPSRPFFRNMIAAHEGEWGGNLGNLIETHGYDAHKLLSLMGELIAGQIRNSIQATNSPPNAPATIARKGHDKVLIDSGHMYNSVDYEVE